MAPFGASPARRLILPVPLDHEIKHDGYRLMARRDTFGIRLITRQRRVGG